MDFRAFCNIPTYYGFAHDPQEDYEEFDIDAAWERALEEAQCQREIEEWYE